LRIVSAWNSSGDGALWKYRYPPKISCGRPDRRHVERLDVIDDVGDRIEPLLERVDDLVVHRADRFGREPGLGEVG
jgi:hypothetical protein